MDAALTRPVGISAAAVPVIFAAIAALLLSPGLVAGPSNDVAVFVVVGEGLIRGELPYRDLWDHKPPAVYVLSGMMALLPGPTWPALWVASVAAVTVLGSLAHRIAGGVPALLVVVGAALWPVAHGGGYTETFALVAAAWAWLAAERGHALRAGVILAVGLGFSLQVAPAVLAFIALKPGGARGVLLGIVLGIAGWLAWLASSGILLDAVDAVVVYSRAYLSLDRSGDLDSLVWMLVPITPLLVGISFSWDRRSLAAGVWLAAGLLAIALQGRLFPHYIIPILLPLAVLARERGRLMVASAAAAIVLSAFTIHLSDSTYEAVGQAVANETTPSDRVLMWGHAAQLYLESERAPAGRYPYLMPLVTPGYTTQQMIGEWVTELTRNPPMVIVDAEAANRYWPDTDDLLRAPPPGAAGGRDLDLLEPLRGFVIARYEYLSEVGEMKIYRLVGEGP